MFQTAHTAKRPPGPTGLDAARWMARAYQNTFRAFFELSCQYGEAVRVPFSPNRGLYIFSDPDDVKHVLQDNHRNYKKAVTYSFLEPVVGKGLLTSEGDHWMRQRRLVAPMFHRRRIRTFADQMVESTAEMLDDWERRAERGESIDIAAEMSRLTLSIAGKILFNRDIGRESDRIGQAMTFLFRDVNKRIISPVSIPRSVPTPHNKRVQEAIDELESIVYGLIDERRGEAAQYDDLLSMLMLAEDEETGEQMSDRQIRDEVMTFMIAGHETTSNALAWTFYLLSLHPDIRRMLEDEVDHGLAGQMPTHDELGELDYVDMVLDESMRLYPPAWTIEREPIEDDQIGDYHVPAGSIVVVGPYFVHHNADVWENPEGFDPERFGPMGSRPDHRYAHFPFGGGPRMCVGSHFAMMEARLIVAAITRRFRLDVIPGQNIEPEGTVTLYPKSGIEMDLIARS
jgi:cytochrome P450